MTWRILGMGCSAVDDLLFVRAYPPADAKAQIVRRQRHCGGLTATALVAASRLGVPSAYAGTLGSDELSRFVAQRLAQEGVDTRHVVWRDDARPIYAMVVVDEVRHTRNIFFEVPQVVGADPHEPPAEVIRAAQVLLVDHHGMEGVIRAAKIAQAAGIPVVADIEDHSSPLFEEVMERVSHLVVSEEFAIHHLGLPDPIAAVGQLAASRREAVVVTCGSHGCWYAGAEDPTPRHQPAFSVNVVDTTGCGDVFHGAYAAALAEGMPLAQRVRFAAAAAALKAQHPGGQQGIPRRGEVDAFLDS